MKKQVTSDILMIQPVHFNYNEQTAENNYFQEEIEELSSNKIQDMALAEFEGLVNKLRENGINVITVQDTEKSDTPDSVFPNNWVSFHENGSVCLYPMFAVNRRRERRKDILEHLSNDFQITEIVDLSGYENEGKFLEGTGSMCFDRPAGIVYAAISDRTHEELLEVFAKKFGCELVTFMAMQDVEGERMPIYHTNVMMCVAEDFAVLCKDSIDDTDKRNKLLTTLEKSGKEVIEITEKQLSSFAGNMLQVKNRSEERFLVMSSSAYNSLGSDQIIRIEKYCKIIHSPLDTIETCGGGSARCMMAEIFLPQKTKNG